MARPTKYTIKLANEICERLANGESLVSICLDKHVPSRMTVMRWLNANSHEGFVTEYARAREMQGDYMDDLILKTANECVNDTAQADRVKIGAYQWRAAKLRPNVYGDHIRQEISGPNGKPIELEVKPSSKLTGFLDVIAKRSGEAGEPS